MKTHFATIALAISGILCAAPNRWTSLGPEGGAVARLAADPQNPSTVYAATCGGGIFKTNDGGASWTAVTGLPDIGCNPNSGTLSATLAVDPQNAGTVYAAKCADIFKTTDGGAIWSLISSVKSPICLQGLVFGNPGTLYATRARVSNIDGGEIFKSTDGAATWTHVSSGFELLAIDPQNQDTMYANGPGYGLFKSTDGGASWNSIMAGPPVVSSLIIDPQNSATLYAGAWWRIFKSTDGGASWIPLTFVLPAPGPTTVAESVLSLAINSRNPTLIYALANRFSDSPGVGPKSDFFLATSTDGGASWTTATDPILAVADLVTIMPDHQDTGTLYLGTSSGVLKTTDRGGHWNFANSGLRAAPAGQVVIDSQTAGTLFAVALRDRSWHGAGLFKSIDGGHSWFPSSFGLPWGVAGLVADPQNPRTLYIEGPHNGGAGTFFGNGVFKSDDAGASWSEIWSISTWGTSLGPLAISAQTPNVIYSGVSACSYGCNSKVARSSDAGRTWTQPQTSLTTEEYISTIALDPRNPDVVYAGTADLGGWGTGGLFKSVDGGVSWRKLTNGAVYFPLLIDPRNPDTIYLGGARSTDGGETWTNLRAPCDPYFGAFAFDPQGSGTVYCGDNAKVFRSADAGASWSEVGSGLRGRVNSLTFDPQNPTTLYAATSGGVFAITLDTQQQPAAAARRAR